MTLIEFQRPKPGQEVLGGNGPPNDVIDDARDTYKVVATWLVSNPTVTDEGCALAANNILGVAADSLTVLEQARSDECDPMHAAWKAARARWAPAIESIEKLKDVVAGRLQVFMLAEEAKRKAVAEQARRDAAALEAAAREAERQEAEARQNAALGEYVDVVAATEVADQAFDEYKEAEREAKIAEKDSVVKLRSRFATKATKLRDHKKLVIVDVEKALTAVGITEAITEAILTEARKFKKDFGRLPDGVIEETERGL